MARVIAILLVATLFAVGCLAPTARSTGPAGAATAPHSSASATSVIPRCSPDRSGPARLVVRRGYVANERFQLLEARFQVDGMEIYRSTDEARLTSPVEVVRDATVASGIHEITTLQKLKGVGSGSLAILNSYSFEVRSKHLIKVDGSGTTCATVTLFLSDDETEPLHKRVSVRYEDEPPEATVPQPWASSPPEEADPRPTNPPATYARFRAVQ